ncbi:hypothetical protein CEXT_545931 [Caerostris extrusa]|uniref:Uncharacterized protein n=1 Tax=Caerostris extrusa TaxID=172846 RepID=A0AAV4P1K6_CAEEX|nr:hypothetical protein CEXT_545931 [Caerostris extrusa]
MKSPPPNWPNGVVYDSEKTLPGFVSCKQSEDDLLARMLGKVLSLCVNTDSLFMVYSFSLCKSVALVTRNPNTNVFKQN